MPPACITVLALVVAALLLVVAVTAEDVRAKDLVKERITAKQVLAHARQTDEASAGVKHFSGPTLAYVTPWNGAGYEAAKQFAAKWTYIAPVWYRLERPSGGELVPLGLVGRQDVDAKWMAAVRAAATPSPLIVPRLYVDPNERVTDVEWMVIVTELLNECDMHGFDGLVLDVGFAAVRAFQEGRIGFLHHIARELHSRNLRFLLSVPPSVSMFSAANFAALVDEVDGFSLMTYDHHNGGAGGPVSPHWWATQSVLNLLSAEMRRSPAVRAKVLLGANLYGYEYPPGGHQRALTGPDLLRLLEQHKATARFEWDAEAHEHRMTYRHEDGRTSTVWYPSLLSVSDRIALAEQLGVGLSLWEIGQPLPYLFDLL